jgi:opacity protein-like surface antigen
MAQHAGPYAGVYLGGGLLADARAVDDLGAFTLEFKPDLLGSVVLGWDLGLDNLLGEGRVELEYARRSNRLDRVDFVEGSFAASGRMVADSFMFNCIGVSHGSNRWSPYVVVGLGAARIAASGLQVTGRPLGDDKATVFAYQLGGGVAYVLTEALQLDLGYRFFNSTKPEFTEANGDKYAVGYLNHSVMFGVRLGF